MNIDLLDYKISLKIMKNQINIYLFTSFLCAISC